MPVNYEQLHTQMKQAGKTLRLRHDAFSRAADRYEAQMHAEAANGSLTERIAELLSAKSDIRCAIPKEEAINSVHPLPVLPPVKIRLLACDGSQISPSRHDEISFGLINTAVVEYITNSGLTPRIITRTRLLPFDDLPTENLLGVQRDAAEKRFLAEAAADAEKTIPCFALSDGPLELFTDTPDMKGQDLLKAEYIEALVSLAEARVPAAGYIDRPRSDPVIRMLDLLRTGGENEEKNPGADDSMIFSRLLEPGDRSAIFGMNSRLNRDLKENLRLCFFYMNIGRPGHPYISRVELPAWAAEDDMIPDLLHAVLIEQCGILGGHPYPFILHRAHESAVITFAEKEEIKNLLLREMAVNGLTPPEKSNKQIAKDLGNRS
ncbi:MAG: DNA double-strand break repair nuclease NurA [Anaerolineaceae bacterium]|nr:DNA double-strand break repair nuclease NurA [Anaerolineaceae bacterium]